MKTLKKLIALLSAVILCISISACNSQPAASETAAQTETGNAVLQETADWLINMVEEPGYGSVGGEWVTLGLARSELDMVDSWFEDYYQSLCTYTAECGGVLDRRKYTEYSRVILTVTSIGKDPTDIAGFNLLKPLADFDQTVFQGINGPIFALLALDSGNYEIPENENFNTQATRELYVDYILNAQLSEGGWSLSGGTAEADITAMALQALAKYRDRQDVAEAVECGLAILSEQQNENGGYTAYDTQTSETISQVIVALTELGIDMDDVRFVKADNTLLDALLCFRTEDGGFCHQLENDADLLATEQAFYALVAIDRMEQGKTSLYSMK